jgi:hypothetical protein
MKDQGRLRALFASDHGSPEHMRQVLERDVFDALMLAWNPLGFHIITFRPDTVWQIETPPLPLRGAPTNGRTSRARAGRSSRWPGAATSASW